MAWHRMALQVKIFKGGIRWLLLDGDGGASPSKIKSSKPPSHQTGRYSQVPTRLQVHDLLLPSVRSIGTASAPVLSGPCTSWPSSGWGVPTRALAHGGLSVSFQFCPRVGSDQGVRKRLTRLADTRQPCRRPATAGDHRANLKRTVGGQAGCVEAVMAWDWVSWHRPLRFPLCVSMIYHPTSMIVPSLYPTLHPAPCL